MIQPLLTARLRTAARATKPPELRALLIEAAVEIRSLRQRVLDSPSALNKRDKQMLAMRLRGATYPEIAAKFDISRTRVEQILKRAATERGMQLTSDGRVAMPRPDPTRTIRKFEAALRD